jgi:spermidine synthase
MSSERQTGARPRHLLLVPFLGTTLASAALLFWIQPLFSKTLLPLLGGAPVVWNTTLVFYQLVLLAGYGYVHLLTRLTGHRLQLVIHLGLCLLAFAFLPVRVATAFPDATNPVSGLLILLAISLGGPILIVSATAPLLQRWFAQTSHPGARDPYFLYAASNTGSILALLAFPVLLEPHLSLSVQRQAWSLGFVGLVALLGLCGLLAVRSGSEAAIAEEEPELAGSPVSWANRLHWMALAAVPASLLLGVTQHITTDIASVPLLWVLPLLVYLLTYVLAFSRRQWVPDRWIFQGQAFALVLGGVWIWALTGIRSQIALHTILLFVLALACHWELANRRPRARDLTEFYVFVSLGGVLGGAFNAILAPLVFRNTVEYGIAAALACMLRPGTWGGDVRQRVMDIAWPLLLFGGGIGVMRAAQAAGEIYPYAFLVMVLGFVIAGFTFKNRPLRYGLTAAVFLAVGTWTSMDRNVIEQARSYFGTYDVVYSEEDNANILFHGTTIHGIQMLDPDLRTRPTSYYTESGPLGQVFGLLRSERDRMRVGLVGLGVGSALCYAAEGDSWTVYEIDPLVFTLASDAAYFHHWAECARRADTVLRIGDARMRLRGEKTEFDLLILDAYTSDAIPVHLITLEALELYRQRLRPGGLILFHISNRHLALDRVLTALARETGMSAFIQEHHPDNTGGVRANASVWVALGERPGGLPPLQESGWDPLDADRPALWRDDYSNILAVLR